jgi:hypothetical protein
MALASYTIRANQKSTSATDIFTNTGLAPVLIGEIIAVNLDNFRNKIMFEIYASGVARQLPNAFVEPNTSSIIMEFKLPYALQTGEKLRCQLGTAGTNGFDIHVFYCVEE